MTCLLNSTAWFSTQTSLFVNFINDISHNITSKIHIFVKNAVIYHGISKQEEHQHFQHGLDTLTEWAKIDFSITKCLLLY